MENIFADYPVSYKDVWRILSAGVMVAERGGDWNTVGAILAIREKVRGLPEYDTITPKGGGDYHDSEHNDDVQVDR